jgi:hypothetical protein
MPLLFMPVVPMLSCWAAGPVGVCANAPMLVKVERAATHVAASVPHLGLLLGCYSKTSDPQTRAFLALCPVGYVYFEAKLLAWPQLPASLRISLPHAVHRHFVARSRR